MRPAARAGGLVLALVATACTAAPPTTPANAPQGTGSLADVPAVSARALPTVVKVLTGGGNGSGVIYTADGLILTNEHVIRGASSVQIAFADGRRSPGTVRAVDVATDLALVQTDRRDLPVARFQPQLPVIGELAVVIGSPLGFENSVTAGVVSGLHRELPGSASETQALVDLVQTDAAISPGNSGGAVVNSRAEVIGISEAYIPPQAGAVSLGFAIPAATATDIAEQLRTTGRARHAFAGLEPTQITPQIATQLRLPSTDGVIVAATVPGGPAATAGLNPGDVILTADAQPTRRPEDFLGVLRRRAPGDKIALTLRGPDGQQRSTELTLTDRPAFSQ
ncbi:trypsin-like peptidase domain-containing protein [Amycolatopsis rhabdoformis]|uniref:Trypsin-like peptidase domain-containing protein n=1 Tax=Amycolatopsis rhabdoformis TaxID=1448059 RepID=A0ABZ1IE49_9PSEU|nr:trypsin-like peptidase domain-containing protein [Amycolatopsis rhabdoformis]WSE32361.1 trypsin-like peptidase domain-containing protein [Amycolatopsis rhabdoformis]